jgi:signal transduction histidine kinase
VYGLRKGETRFDVELAVSGFQRDDRRHWIVVARDITEQIRLENELKRSALEQRELNQSLGRLSAAADDSNRAKSEFLASMSHEIRTPMTAILGYVELLRGELQSPSQLHAVDTIRRNADFLLEIINDLLDLSKIEARKFDIEAAPVSPRAVLAEVAALMVIRAESKGIRLTTELRGPIPATIETDAKRLKQILINLVGNAIKFTDEGEVRLVVSQSAVAGEIVLSVVDTGIGMSADELPLVFQPFLQGQSTAARRVGGTGLGLTIARHLAELLGGRLEVESVPGSGSTFRLCLPSEPLASAPAARPPVETPVETHVESQIERHVARPAAPKSPTPRLACRVLAADDRRDNQLLIERILQKAGAEVKIAGDGRSAVEQVIEAAAVGTPFDVVLMDMQMPELDGYEATAQLRAAGYRVPIIALTASAMKGDHQRCLEVGCDDYLPKPIDFRLLVEMVARYVPSGDGS